MMWFPWRMVGISGLSLSFFFLFSSSSLVSMWMSLEFNFFCFVPLMSVFEGTSTRERESIVLYFLFQSFFSLFFLLGFFFFFYQYSWLGPIMILLSVIGKMGSFPFYFWVPPVVAPLSYEATWMLLSIQKLAPMGLYMAFINTFSGDFVFFIVVMSFLVSAVGGYNQSWLRPFMAFSSIAQSGWFMMSGFGGMELFLTYFSVYAVTLKILLNMADHHMGFLFFCPYRYWQGSWWPKVTFLSLFFSLGGLPPFPGFFMKFFVIWVLSSFISGVKLMVLVTMAGLTLFFYGWYSFKSLMINNMVFLFTREIPKGYSFLSIFFFFFFGSWLLIFLF